MRIMETDIKLHYYDVTWRLCDKSFSCMVVNFIDPISLVKVNELLLSVCCLSLCQYVTLPMV